MTEIVTGAVSWIQSFLGVVEGSNLMLFFLVFGLSFVGVGLIKRLIRL